MVANPKLLLLDEPTSQLDPLSAERFWQVVRRIRTELGTAIVICEHRTEHFFADCDRILYIENGKQRFVLPPNEAANALKNSEMLDGFPCAIRISSAVGDENQPLLTSVEAARYIKNRYSQARIDTHFGGNDSRSQTELSPALAAKNISFRYDRYGRDVLCGLDFTAYFGEITAICGANGTGKSTLLKLLAGVFRPQEGRICVDGKRISSYKGGSLYRNMLAMLPQNPCDILIEETVLGELSHSPNGENYQREEIDSLLERLGIAENLLDSHPFDLSGGEVQRVALAKLLLTKPRILLLDEPTKGLDPVCKRRLSEILRRLAEEGTAVIFVTHDLDFAAEVSDRTALVFGGRVVTAEPTVEFLQKNYVYTTSAARIGRAVFPTAVSGRRLISACLEAERERDGR
jgi:energy-coupling factor transport system ATP-binding protein